MPVTKRFIRKRVRRKKQKEFHLEINSLLDILVILLVFLIKSYSSSDVVINIPKNIQVPLSKSQSYAKQAIIVQMSKDQKIWMDETLIVDMRQLGEDVTDEIPGLFEALKNKKRQVTQLNVKTNAQKTSSDIVNLIMDKSLPYDFIRRIMYTATEAGFKEFKFIVIGSD